MHKNRKPIFGVGINDHPQSVWVSGVKMIKFNMNNYVWFEPTELGLQVFVDYYKEFGFDHKLEVVNGKACLQFHNFIRIYGDYITSYICKDKEIFKHYEFYIDEEKLL